MSASTAESTAPSRRPLAIRAVLWYRRTFAGGPPTCRFHPSCSSYALESLEVHGTPRGLWLTVRRLARCRPFGPSGVDPVPMPGQSPRAARAAVGSAGDPLPIDAAAATAARKVR